jgi:hypothetical protein
MPKWNRDINLDVRNAEEARRLGVPTIDDQNDTIEDLLGGLDTLQRTAVNAQTADYTLALTDAGKVVLANKGTAITITVPTNAAVAFPVATELVVAQKGAGATTIAAAGGVTVHGATTIPAQYGAVRLVKVATDEWYCVEVPVAGSHAAVVASVATEATNRDAAIATALTPAISSHTADYTLALTDAAKVVVMDKATALTLTVPPNVDVAFVIGQEIKVVQKGAGLLTIAAGAGVTVRNAGATAGQYSRVVLTKVATNEWYLTGDLA